MKETRDTVASIAMLKDEGWSVQNKQEHRGWGGGGWGGGGVDETRVSFPYNPKRELKETKILFPCNSDGGVAEARASFNPCFPTLTGTSQLETRFVPQIGELEVKLTFEITHSVLKMPHQFKNIKKCNRF